MRDSLASYLSEIIHRRALDVGEFMLISGFMIESGSRVSHPILVGPFRLMRVRRESIKDFDFTLLRLVWSIERVRVQ